MFGILEGFSGLSGLIHRLRIVMKLFVLVISLAQNRWLWRNTAVYVLQLR